MLCSSIILNLSIKYYNQNVIIDFKNEEDVINIANLDLELPLSLELGCAFLNPKLSTLCENTFKKIYFNRNCTVSLQYTDKLITQSSLSIKVQ